MRYRYLVIQAGTLPLSPDGSLDSAKEHRCTSAAIWPDGGTITPPRAMLTDACFTIAGLKHAHEDARRAGISLDMPACFFITHCHRDHIPVALLQKNSRMFHNQVPREFPDMKVERCPGHSPDLHALIFHAPDGKEVWVVGDAILNLEWLVAWGYFWPNGYTPAEIAETWRSVAKIVSRADVILPGHGDEIIVTAPLVQQLLSAFPSAEQAAAAPEVAPLLQRRLAALRH